MVGVAVTAGSVVCGQQRGSFLAQQVRQPGRGPLDVHHRERLAPAVDDDTAVDDAPAGDGTVEPGVTVAEELHPGTAQRLCGRAGLGHPQLAQPVPDSGLRRGKALLSRRGEDQHDPVAIGREAGHGAGGQQSLVVRMGMEEDARVPHSGRLPRLHAGTAEAAWRGRE